MSRFHRPLYITLLLILGFWLAGQEFVRAGQTSVLPVIELPAELPPRTSPTEADPELQAFLARAQRVSWAFGGIFGYGSALQIQDAAGRVNGRDAHGQIHISIPDSTYITYVPFEVSGEGGLAGTLPYGEPATIVVWGKEALLAITLHVYVDLPRVARTTHVGWERAVFHYQYQSPPEVALPHEGVAWLPLPAGPWTRLPAMYMDYDGDQHIDAVIEPEPIIYEASTVPALQPVGLPVVLPPREKPTRIPVEQYERVFTGWQEPPPVFVSKATRVLLQRRSGWLQGVDEQGRGWGPIPGTPYMLMGGNSHGPINDPEEYALAEIQPMKVGEMAVVMGPLYLVPPPQSAYDEAQREAFLASDVLEIWYGPIAVTTASVLWLELPPAPWEHFPPLYLDRDGDQVVDEVIEARIEIHPYQERRGGIDGVRRIL